MDCVSESRVLAQGSGLNDDGTRMADRNLSTRWETAVAASLVIAISMIVITLVLTLELGPGIGL